MILHQDYKKIASTYPVIKIQKEITITGRGDSPYWQRAKELSNFIYPWENEKPSFTSFKAMHSDEWLYCLFRANDNSINVYVNTNDKREAARSDRVEIFFRQDESLSPYYCLELDPHGRIFDYKAAYYRKMDTNWTWPADHLMVKTHMEEERYFVELAISKASLKELGLLKNKTLQAGLYRADCIELTGKDATFRWISWIKPDSETPDFHIPSSFGLLRLEE